MGAGDFLLTEKYRPHKIEDCVYPEEIKKIFGGYLQSDKIPNLLLSGSSGVGKTTAAKALCDELDRDYMYINASANANIDMLRTDIHHYVYH